MGKWYALGVATPVQQRAAVIELRTRSEADSREGRRGKTWDEIADEVGGPTSRTCQAIWQRYRESTEVAARPSVPNPVEKLGVEEVQYLVDVYHRFPQYQPVQFPRFCLLPLLFSISS